MEGAPGKRFTAFLGRGGARERTELSPEAEAEYSGLCPDEVEEARAELYHEQARELRWRRSEVSRVGGGCAGDG